MSAAANKYLILAYLAIFPGAQPMADLEAFTGLSEGGLTAAVTPLANSGLVTFAADVSGKLAFTLAAAQTADTIMAAAAGELTNDELLALTEVFASAPVMPPSDGFRTAVLAAGLGATDAAAGGFFARCLALERKRRTGQADLIPAARRSGRVGDLAVTALS
jgi:hypothetical protein